MRIYVPVPESYAAQLKDGMKATLELPEYPDRTFEATIVTTSHAIDQKSRTLLVELLADNKDGAPRSGRVRPRAFRHFRLTRMRSAFQRARCMFRDNSAASATVGLDNRIALKNVRIVRDLGNEVEIAGGLSPGRAHRRQSARFDQRRGGGPGHASRWGEDAERRRRSSAGTSRSALQRPLTRSRKQGGITRE